MKLSALAPRTVELPIVLPNGDASGIVLKVVSKDSVQYKQAAKKFGQSFMDGKKMTIDEADSANAELAASCIVGWTGLENDDGTELTYSPKVAVQLMANPELAFMKEQVEAFIVNRLNFFRGSKAEA
jgi:hypothetical protein